MGVRPLRGEAQELGPVDDEPAREHGREVLRQHHPEPGDVAGEERTHVVVVQPADGRLVRPGGLRRRRGGGGQHEEGREGARGSGHGRRIGVFGARINAAAVPVMLPLATKTGDEVQSIVSGTFDIPPTALAKVLELSNPQPE